MKAKVFYAIGVYEDKGNITQVGGESPLVVGVERTDGVDHLYPPLVVSDVESREQFQALMSKRAGELWDALVQEKSMTDTPKGGAAWEFYQSMRHTADDATRADLDAHPGWILNAFTAGDPAADCNDDERIDTLDFLCFLNEFIAGCP